MRIRTQIFSPDQSDPKLQRRLFIADQICLFLALQIALINLLWRAFPSVDKSLPAGLLHMSASNAGAALCAVLALFLAEAARGKRIRWLSRMFAVMTTLVAAAPVLARMVGTPNEVGRFGAGNSLTAGRGLLPATALVFVLLGIVILFVQDGKSVTGHIADGLTAGVCLLMLVLLLDFLFDLAHVPGSSKVGLPPLATLGCAMLVTSATVIRRMEHGTFAIFLGYGIGSRFARFLAPILLIMPFWREVMRARMMNSGLIPKHYVTPILTSVAIIVAFALLLWLARLVNRMQREIQDLTLRDELTGVYSVRGFNLLAEQAFRQARRAQTPFGVLFIDMDNLKLINDELGHEAGSRSLAETSKLLQANLRETDIIGRVGGDEFAVVGEFNSQEMLMVIDRLRSAAAHKKTVAGRQFSISLSIGSATLEDAVGETLKDLVARADKAMYEEKREKKKDMVRTSGAVRDGFLRQMAATEPSPEK